MRYFENPNDSNKVYGYTPESPAGAGNNQQNLIDDAVAAGWVEVTGSWPPAPTLSQQWAAYQGQCLAALNAIDTTMMRIVTAISLGKLSSTDAMAQAWFTYQSDLRAQLSATQPATIPPMPTKPTSYPAGT